MAANEALSSAPAPGAGRLADHEPAEGRLPKPEGAVSLCQSSSIVSCGEPSVKIGFEAAARQTSNVPAAICQYAVAQSTRLTQHNVLGIGMLSISSAHDPSAAICECWFNAASVKVGCAYIGQPGNHPAPSSRPSSWELHRRVSVRSKCARCACAAPESHHRFPQPTNALPSIFARNVNLPMFAVVW